MEMLNVKVGVMPGKLEEVVVESGTKVKEIFALANIDIAGYETRLDGVVVDADKPVFNGALLVAMKKIKGNVNTIKVGIMPGKLTEIVVNDNTTAKEAFQLADLDVSGYEMRLDGAVIDEDVVINNGNLLVAMKKIKGNVWKIDELETFLNNSPYEYGAPKLVKEVTHLGDVVVLDGRYTMSKEDFEKVYFEVEEHTCSCDVCTCEKTDEYDIAMIKDALEDVQSAIGKLSVLALKLEVVLENK